MSLFPSISAQWRITRVFNPASRHLSIPLSCRIQNDHPDLPRMSCSSLCNGSYAALPFCFSSGNSHSILNILWIKIINLIPFGVYLSFIKRLRFLSSCIKPNLCCTFDNAPYFALIRTSPC